MVKRSVLCCFLVLLITAVAFAGCTSHQAPAPAPVATVSAPAAPAPGTPAVTAAPETAKPEKSVEAPLAETREATGKVILSTKGLIGPTEYKTFDFKSMGDEFSKIGEKYTITLKADKPVLGYAVTTTQADELQGREMTPSYDSSSDKIQWGLITPYMSLGKVTDSSKTFTVDAIHQYVYVVDARWMQSNNDYKNLPAFNYELTISKVPAPDTSGKLVYG